MISPFTPAWDPDRLAALRDRLAHAAPPVAIAGAGWSLGCDPAFLDRFRRYWLDEYDVDGALADLNRYPHFMADIGAQRIHFVHVRSGAGGRPLLLTHGWPGSFHEFWEVADPLLAAGFDLVIPSLPGYAFSGPPARPIGPRGTAALWDGLMAALGYDAYLAQGGDWGSLVTAQIARFHPARLRGIHLNMLGLRSPEPARDEAEARWLEASAATQQRLSAYAALQMMKPQSLACATAGNPLGQAAWILERFHDWADLSAGDIETVFGLDRLVTNAMLYVMTDSFATSLWFYHGLLAEGGADLAPGERVAVPTGFAAFPGDALMPPPPRSRVAASFDLAHWAEPEAGGHFAAMERPDLFAASVIEWADAVWPA